MEAEAFTKNGMSVIQYVAKAYCGFDDQGNISPVWNECLLLLRKEFRAIGLEEIRYAFRLASAGKINANLIAYRGVFTVQMFGAVLEKYTEFRRMVHASIVNAEHATIEQQQQQQKADKWRAEFVALVCRIEGLIRDNKEVSEWSQIGAGWYEAMDAQGWINVDSAYKGAAWIESKRHALSDFLADPQSGLLSNTEAMAIKRQLSKDPGVFPSNLDQKARLIYRKKLAFLSLAVFEE